MDGPWSDPIDMGIKGYIDPGHAVGEDGKRYLFLNGGARVQISDDGLRRDGPIEQVYGGWPIPDDWVVEAPALEGPKGAAPRRLVLSVLGSGRHRRAAHQPHGYRRAIARRSRDRG